MSPYGNPARAADGRPQRGRELIESEQPDDEEFLGDVEQLAVGVLSLVRFSSKDVWQRIKLIDPRQGSGQGSQGSGKVKRREDARGFIPSPLHTIVTPSRGSGIALDGVRSRTSPVVDRSTSKGSRAAMRGLRCQKSSGLSGLDDRGIAAGDGRSCGGR